jgi:hypothetical protein
MKKTRNPFKVVVLGEGKWLMLDLHCSESWKVKLDA